MGLFLRCCVAEDKRLMGACVGSLHLVKEQGLQKALSQCFPWHTNCNRFIFVCCQNVMYIKSKYDLNSGLLTLSGFCNHFCSRFCLLELNGIFRTRVVEIQRSKEQSHGICRCPTQTSVVFIRHQREENKQEGTTPIRNTHFVFRFATVS